MTSIQNLNLRRWLIIVSLIAGLGLGTVLWQGAIGQDRPATGEANGVEKAKSLSRAFRAAAKQVIPTVVKIKTTTKPMRFEGGGSSRENPFKGTPFEDFFRDDMPGNRFYHPPIPRREGLGSGVIIDRSGIILTNNHVVADADAVLIELADGRQFKATDIKTDKQTDLAVLRIDAGGSLPAAALGDSDAMEIGDWVIAVGNPFDLELTVSAGIISGKGRALAAGRRANFLQTDAAINPGNSGGPLVNLDGEVVGINTAIASSTGAYQGVGFAIPANLAKWVTSQLIKTGNVLRAYLGVGIGEISDDVARALGIDRAKGVLVTEVFPDTPAAVAGFREGDVILTFAGHEVGSPRQLQEVVERSPAGSKQKVGIIRDRKPASLTVVVKPLPGDFGLASAPLGSDDRRNGDSPAYSNSELGLEVGDLTTELAKRLGYEGFQGVLITDAEPDGIAAAAGIRSGMLILRVGNKIVKSVDEFKAALKTQSLEKGVLLLIRTEGGNRFVVLKQE